MQPGPMLEAVLAEPPSQKWADGLKLAAYEYQNSAPAPPPAPQLFRMVLSPQEIYEATVRLGAKLHYAAYAC